MGSLMAGWDSPVSDPQTMKYRKTKSLTKEEIEAYWRSKKQIEEEHQRYISMLSPQSLKKANIVFEEAAKAEQERLNLGELSDLEREESLDQLIKKNGWWISSNWAHLNEPPLKEPEGATYKYVSQFHVANMANGSNTKPGPTGINA
ncbi:RER1B family protein [Capsicum annuum]|nr:RER1B family protein [Capsicum annuum]